MASGLQLAQLRSSPADLELGLWWADYTVNEVPSFLSATFVNRTGYGDRIQRLHHEDSPSAAGRRLVQPEHGDLGVIKLMFDNPELVNTSNQVYARRHGADQLHDPAEAP